VKHELELKWPHGTIKSKGDVCGCGLVLNSDNKLSIFFTGNGLPQAKLIGMMSGPTRLFQILISQDFLISSRAQPGGIMWGMGMGLGLGSGTRDAIS
jgi:hypothetical protein